MIRLITLWDLLGCNLRSLLLKRSPIFNGLTRTQAKKLVLLAEIETHPVGSTIIQEGKMGHEMYVIIEGEVEVTKNQEDGNTKQVAKLDVGQIFGEIALVAEIKRTANIIATKPTKTLVLDWGSLGILKRYSPYLSAQLFLNISRILGQRLNSVLKQK